MLPRRDASWARRSWVGLRAPVRVGAQPPPPPKSPPRLQFVRPWFVRHQGAIEAQFQRLAEVRTAITTVVGVDPLSLAARPAADAEPGEEAGGAPEDLAAVFAAHGQGSLPTVAPASVAGGGVGGNGKRE